MDKVSAPFALSHQPAAVTGSDDDPNHNDFDAGSTIAPSDGQDDFYVLTKRLTDEYDRVSSELRLCRGQSGKEGAQIATDVEKYVIPGNAGRQVLDPILALGAVTDHPAQKAANSSRLPGVIEEDGLFVSESSDCIGTIAPSDAGSTIAFSDAGSTVDSDSAVSSWPGPVPRSASTSRRTTRIRATKMLRPSASKSKTIRAGCFELESIWMLQEETGVDTSGFGRQQSSFDEESTTITYYNGILRHVIALPSSPKLIAWDMLGALLIFYDLFAIPLGAFPYPRGTFTHVSSWITLMFWTINMLSSLLVGYVDNGVIIMVPRLIAMNYLKSWFLIDIAVVIPDWVFSIAAITDQDDSSGGSVRLLRILRLVRMTRLVRLLKLRRLIQKLHDLVDSEYLSIVMNILKMLMFLLITNHVIACLWYFVGSQHAGNSWISHHGFADEDWGHQYAVAYHWSITQFTPASMHVQPQNVPERVFAISVVVFALVGFAYVIGSITGSLTQLRQMQEEATKQFWNLRRYLKHKKVPLELCARIQCYLEHAWENEQRVQNEKKVRILSLLSEQLISELQYMLYAHNLGIHPLFGQLTKASSVSMHRLAYKAMSTRQMARKDPVFVYQEKATHMYLVIGGQLKYLHAETGVREDVEQDEDWISESILWTTRWVHLGHLNAVTESDLLLVNPKNFAEIVQKNPAAYALAATYARNFLAWLNALRAEDLSDIFQGENVSQQHREFCDCDSSSDDEPQSPSAMQALRGKFGRSVTRMVGGTRAGTKAF